MTEEQFILLGKVIGAIITIAGGICGFYRLVIYPYVQIPIQNKIIFLWNIAIDAASIHQIIKKEFTTGGSSIKDSIKRIEETLSINENRFKSYLSLKKEPVWESDSDGNCKWVNDSYIKLTGYSLEHLKNLGWITTIKDSEQDEVQEQWMRAVEEKRIFSYKFTIVSSSGVETRVHAHGYPILSKYNDIAGYIGILQFLDFS